MLTSPHSMGGLRTRVSQAGTTPTRRPGGLIVTSLVLLSAHFSEAESGPLHAIQRATATVLSPLESVASEALKPARDLIDWFDETCEARGENEELQEELAEVRPSSRRRRWRRRRTRSFAGCWTSTRTSWRLRLQAGDGADHHPLTERGQRDGRRQRGFGGRGRGGRRCRRPPTAWSGRVTEVTSGSAQVQLITDPRNAVSAGRRRARRASGNRSATPATRTTCRFSSSRTRRRSSKAVLVTAGWADRRRSRPCIRPESRSVR